MSALWVALGALIGAPARYLLDRAVQRRHRADFPYGTLVVNVAACLLLGFITELVSRGAPTVTQLVAGTGFCATFSTYSTFSAETVQLARRGAPFSAAANAAVSTVAGTLAASAGYAVAALLLR